MTTGQRVQITEVFAPFDARHHRLGTLGTITGIDHQRPRAPYIVTHDDGVKWRYCERSLRPIDSYVGTYTELRNDR